jgi:hypothetical protein
LQYKRLPTLTIVNLEDAMDKETLEALEGSIKKWESIVAGTGEDKGTDNCPLCIKFYDLEEPETEDNLGDPFRQQICYGCPISIASGEIGCGNTPYAGWSYLVHGCDYPHKADTQPKIEASQRELDFLKSLRPDSGVDPN